MPCRVPKRRFSCGAPQHLTKNLKKAVKKGEDPFLAAFLRSFQLNELWNRLIHDGAFIFLQQTFLDTKRQRDPPAIHIYKNT